MFCPKCGQQFSDEVRFCQRCGLSVAGLAAYVAGNETATVGHPAPQPAAMTARRRGMRRGAMLMFLCAALMPVAVALADGVMPGPLLLVMTAFLVGLAWLVHSWLFGDNVLPIGKGTGRRDLSADGDRPALGAPQFTPAPLFNQQRTDTTEIYQPPSVTETTTKLLEKDS